MEIPREQRQLERRLERKLQSSDRKRKNMSTKRVQGGRYNTRLKGSKAK